jgi:hypothetical protein
MILHGIFMFLSVMSVIARLFMSCENQRDSFGLSEIEYKRMISSLQSMQYRSDEQFGREFLLYFLLNLCKSAKVCK